MPFRDRNLKVFRGLVLGLVIFYSTVFAKFFNWIEDASLRVHILVLLFAYGALILSLISCRQQRNSAVRIFAVYANLFISLYLIVLFLYYPKFGSLTLAFVHIVTAMFLDMSSVKVLFTKELVRKRKILIVDDDVMIQKSVKPILESNGMEVVAALNGEEGLKLAAVEKPDLIVLDVIMPGLKGREVCQRLKSDPVTRNIPVIFFTHKDSPDDIQAELKAGAIGHLSKPIHPQILIAELNKIIK